MEELLKPFVEKALQIAEKSGEFVIEQAPELLQQFYAWNTAKHIVWGLFFFLLFGCSTKFVLFITKKYDADDFECVFGCVFGGSAVLMGAIGVVTHMMGLLKISLAPKLYLIEHFINTGA